MKTKILLLGAGGNAGQNFTRCIHKSDQYEVVGCDIDPYKLETAITDKKYLIDQDLKLSQLTEIVAREDIKMIHAQPDTEVRWLINNKYRFPGLTFGHDLLSWQKYYNKDSCQVLWKAYFNLEHRVATLEECIKKSWEFKSLTEGTGKAWIRARHGAGSKAALPINTLEQALNWATYWKESKGVPFEEFILSEFLPGKEFAVQLFYVKGEIIHSFARERVLSFFANVMPSGQSSTPFVQRTVQDKAIYERADRAVRVRNYQPHGIYGVDIKTSHRGELVPTEVNYGRFFSTSNFPASLGVNTPLTYINNFLHGTFDYSIEKPEGTFYEFRGLDHEPIIRESSNCLLSVQ